MNSGNSVQDADPRCAPAVSGQDADRSAQDGQRPRPRPSLQHIQDIQEIIDKLADVTRQLRHPGSSGNS